MWLSCVNKKSVIQCSCSDNEFQAKAQVYVEINLRLLKLKLKRKVQQPFTRFKKQMITIRRQHNTPHRKPVGPSSLWALDTGAEAGNGDRQNGTMVEFGCIQMSSFLTLLLCITGRDVVWRIQAHGKQLHNKLLPCSILFSSNSSDHTAATKYRGQKRK